MHNKLEPRLEPKDTTTPEGSKIAIRTRFYVDDDGVECAEPGEEFDLDAYIQASAASTDIATIIAKFEAGDESVLNVRQGFYGDVASLPKNINDIAALDDVYSKVQDQFNTLPADIKALFGNDYRKFAQSVLENKADELIMNVLNHPQNNQQNTPVENVAEGENNG